MLKTDEQILKEYLKETETPVPNDEILKFMELMVHKIREAEPRINSGIHLVDYMSICDDDDDMDSFYGPDYFKE